MKLSMDGENMSEQTEENKTVQRRNHHRAKIPPDSELRLRVWRITEHAILRDAPLRSLEVICELRELSVGGAGVRFVGKQGEAPKVSTADRLRLEIIVDGEPLVFEGRMRAPHEPQQGDSIITGITFKKLDSSIDGRRVVSALNRIVGQLQRKELRLRRVEETPAA
jgi:hypothetical protein